MRILSLLLILVLSSSAILAQPYIKERSRHRFAQTYVGLNTQIVPSSGNFYWKGESRTFPTVTSPRFTIGGMHFWGRLDFNMNIPLASLADFSLDDTSELFFYTGGDLSARFYPWRMEFGKVRPFFGYSANEMTLSLNDEEMGNRSDLLITSSLLGGLSYNYTDWRVKAELMWMLDNTREFYSDRFTAHNFELPKAYFSFGLVKFFEGTLKEEKDRKSGRIFVLEEELRKEGKLNSFSLGFAPSGAYFLLAPHFQDEARQSLPRHKGSMVWEFSAGYLFHDPGLHVGVTYRDYTSGVESYQFEHLIRRRSLAFEAIKFMGDYQGFVPFIGPSISFERWATGEFEQNVQLGETQRTQMISPGIIFGWDIVASPLETWVLRTNLRYYPFQKINGTDGRKIRVDQFEFNFIQLVVYPNRMIHIPKRRNR